MIAKEKHTVWFLEMVSSDQLRKKEWKYLESQFELRNVSDYRINKKMYEQVGGPWQWNDRLVWSDHQWQSYAQRPDILTSVASVNGREIGYVERRMELPKEIQIEYFGLHPECMGKGYGGYFLSVALEECWRLRPGRIWVHTCSYDGPAALQNYLARGFEVFEERVFMPGEEIDEELSSGQ